MCGLKMFNEVDALGSRVIVVAVEERERTLMYLSFSVWNWSAPAVSRISSWRAGVGKYFFRGGKDARNRMCHRLGLSTRRLLFGENRQSASLCRKEKRTFDCGVVVGEEDVVDESHGERRLADAASCDGWE